MNDDQPSQVPVTMLLGDASTHVRVKEAVEGVLKYAGRETTADEDPIVE